MTEFNVRADDVEVQGKIVKAWWQPTPIFSPPFSWHFIVQLSPGDIRLVNAAGKTNLFDYLECQVTPTSPFQEPQYANRLLSDLLNQSVRIRGSWGDTTVMGVPVATLLSPIHWIVTDRKPSPFVEEHGFSQVVRETSTYSSSATTGRSIPEIRRHPIHREDRHADIAIPFPGRPRSITITPPTFAECVDREKPRANDLFQSERDEAINSNVSALRRSPA